MSDLIKLCPCQSGKSYADCCEPLHQGVAQAQTAEKLMRSRYCAFKLGLVAYLLETMADSLKQANEAEALQHSIDSTEWLGLQVIDHGEVSPQQAFVEFVAFYQDSEQQLGQLHERSRFDYADGRWFYAAGEWLKPIKLAVNQACFCGSGRKLKRCHGSS